MNINEIDVLGNTPLIDACIKSNYEIANILVKSGAKLDIINNEGKTALMIACTKTNFDIIKLLIDEGADMTIRELNGNSALMEMLAGDDEENDERKHLDILKYFLKQGYKIDIQQECNETELTMACYGNSTAAAMYLIDMGANVNAKNTEDDYTPLKHAISCKNKILIDYLKRHGGVL